MSPLLLAILLFVIGSVLLVAEFVIPAHGVTAGLGLLAMAVGVITCFFIGEWVGVAVLATAATVGPVAGAGWARLFPRTRFGRRLVLPPIPGAPSGAAGSATLALPVRVGQVGITVSALRPSGVCEFHDFQGLQADANGAGTIRVPAVSDFGPVAPGQPVRVICFSDGRATVRAV